MKEEYFTASSIHREAQQMLDSIEKRIPRRNLDLKPQNSALIVVDMQKYFLDPASHAFIPSAQALIPGINKLVNAFHSTGRPVIFTRHLNSAQNAKLMNRWWKEIITSENPLSHITEDLNVSGGTVIEKSQYDAFYDTPFEDILKANEVQKLIICGVMTQLCCETTARSAFVRGFEVFFTVDGTATYNADFHLATLLNLAYGFATPVLVQEMLTLLKKKNEN